MEETPREFRASFPPELVEDWESYVGDSLESAGMVDEFEQGWRLARARFEQKPRRILQNIQDRDALDMD